MKMNSVTDVDFIQKVSEASRSGVKVDLIVRGICCILLGVTWLYGQCPCDECCRKISGASAYFQFWKWK